MAKMTDEEKTEFKEMMAAGVAEGLALFRSKAEEEAAKNPPQDPPANTGGGNKNDDNDGGFSFAGFLLGGR